MTVILGIVLLLAQAQPASVSGIVMKPGGSTPLQGATVVLNPVVSAQAPAARITRSEDDGRFNIAGVEPGQYRLTVESAQYGAAQYGQRKPNGPGMILNIAAGQRIADVKIALLPTGTISGRITGRSGEPLPFATVQALRYLYQEGKRILTVAQTTTTDDRGEYRLFWLNGGSYVVVAGQRNGPGRPGLVGPLRPGQVVRNAVLQIGLAPGDALLEGRSLGRHILEDGTVQDESWMPTYYPGTMDRAQATAVEVTVGATTTGINITLGPSPVQKIRGRVAGIVPGRQVMVTLGPASQGMLGQVINETPSNLDGSFEFAGVLPGVYFLTAVDRSGLASTPQAVLVGDRDVENVSIALEPAITLTVKITMEGAPGQGTLSAPIFGVLRPDLESLQGGTPGNVRAANIQLGTGNVMVLSGAPGNYQFEIGGTMILMAEGVVRENSKPYFIKSMRLGRDDALNGFLLSASTPSVLDVVLTTEAGSVSGVATGRAGDPAGNVTVVLVPTNARKRSAFYQAMVTGSDGKFSFQGIAPGDYKLFAWDDIENGAWENAEFVRPYESRGRAVRISENSKDDVQLNVIYNP
jgi:hypothetical protein